MSHEQHHKLMDALMKCASECNHCAVACLDEQDVNMLARCIRLDIDCAGICHLSASFVARGSDHSGHVLEACARICEACAEECEKHSHMDHCRKCAETCRHCAELCHSGIAA
jgi:hypothetical protein